MPETPNKPSKLDTLQRAFVQLETLQARLKSYESEPIAIIGTGCRFPGKVGDADSFWDLMQHGREAISEVPAERWDVEAYYDPDPEAPGKMVTRWGAFLEDIDQFDPQLFGISPREAASMDPQQRLLLEVAWEALEDAGQAPDRLSGSRTGVFVGIIGSEYAQLLTSGEGIRHIDTYFGSGVANSVASGRLSYVFGLQGPSLCIDTSCSSSLVAVHLACQSLRSRECRMALAGGVSLMLLPDTTIILSKHRLMAADGRCKTFDQAADGYVRGEGCGMVVLKRASDALADGDRILALIRGIAANQDGPSSGLTAPHGPAQQAVIRAALANGGIDPLAVGYIETHGTGTALGDPIEIQALSAVYGKGRPGDRPVYVGAVKTNIGHLEAAAGIASLLKAVIVLRKRAIPPHRNMRVPNPHIPWEQLPVKVPTRLTEWPAGYPGLVGVSSFGFSGTNVHLVLEAPKAQARPATRMERPRHLLCLSARNAAALNATAERYRILMEAQADLAPGDVCFSANTGRAALPQRLAIHFASLEELRGRLADAASGRAGENLVTGACPAAEPPRVACLFSGESAPVNAGRALFETAPVFREALEKCRAELLSLNGVDLLTLLFPAPERNGDAERQRQQPDLVPPVLYALQTALLALWRSWGVAPTAVAGQGPGEFAAAYAAGVLGLEEGLRMVHACSGSRADTVTGVMQEIAAQIQFAEPQIHWLSGPTGDNLRPDEAADPSHWIRRLQVPAQFEGAFRRLQDKGYRIFLEIGPHPQAGASEAPDAGEAGTRILLPSLRRGADDWNQMLDSLANLYVMGVPVDWVGFEKPYSRMRVPLPTYPLQRRRYWLQGAAPQRAARNLPTAVHPLLGGCIPSALADVQFENSIGQSDFDFINDHRVNHQTIVPATAFIEMAAAGIRAVNGNAAALLEDFVIHRPLLIEAGQRRRVQTIVSPAAGGAWLFQIHSRADSEPDASTASLRPAGVWTTHVSGRFNPPGAVPEVPPATVSLETLHTRCPEEIDGRTHYEELARRGFHFGPVLQGVVSIRRGRGEALGHIRLPEHAEPQIPLFGFHPALLDACLQFFWAILPQDADAASYLPVSFERFRMHGQPAAELFSHAAFRPIATGDKDRVEGDVTIYDATGHAVAAITRLIFRRATPATLQAAVPARIQDWLYQLHWEPRPSPRTPASAPPPEGQGATFAPQIDRIGMHVDQAMPTLAEKHGLKSHQRFVRSVEALSAVYIREALADLGVAFTPGHRFSVDGLVGAGVVQPRYRRLLHRYAQILADGGLLRQAGGDWEVLRAPTGENAAEHLKRLLAEPGGGASAQLELVARCGSRLADALSGKVDPLGLLFPDGNLALAARLYSESAEAAVFNSLVREAVQEALRALPPGRKARILELGAGTGGATSYVLPGLDASRVAYVFSDISPVFLKRAAERFKKYSFVEYRICNIEQGPVPQSFEAQSFDIVIAMNMLHATRDVQESLRNIHEFLVPGGLLILLEGTAPEQWIDITFGLTDGWWAFRDTDLRADYPLLSRAQWIEALRGCGYAEAATAPAPSDLSPEALILASRSAEALVKHPLSTAERLWMVISEENGLGPGIAARLNEVGIACLQVTAGDRLAQTGDLRWSVRPDQPEDYQRVFGDVAARRRVETIVHLWDAGAELSAEATLAELQSAQGRGTQSLLYALQALLKTSAWRPPPDICIATCGALATDPQFAPRIVQAPAWGLCRVMGLEHPDVPLRHVDLDPNAPTSRNAEDLVGLLLAADTEATVALRDGRQWVPRLKPAQATASGQTSTDATDSLPRRLRQSTAGVLDELELEPAELPAPGPGEVQIRVHCAGLSFRDVMNALSMRQDPDPLGSECSGRIARVGRGVSAFVPGDDVIALAAGSLGTHVNTQAAYVVRKPPALSFEAAATLPTAFLTAQFALFQTGGLQPGERVLIHAAAGGVGMAAVQLALAAGAEVFGTAGSASKRAHLLSLGLRAAMDSRSTAFVDDIAALTDGRGVDVVLNSLAGEFIPKSMSVLAPGGRFLEIGKRDILTPDAARQLRPDVRYHVIDLAATSLTAPSQIQSLFQDLVQRVESQKLQPLPLQTFGLSQASAAFRFMSQSRHLGKIVIRNDLLPGTSSRIRKDATYLVTGGLAGLGLLVAQWLADNGARHLALLARKPAGTEAAARIEALRKSGVSVHCLQADVSSVDQTAAALKTIADQMPPLKGVFHLAGVLADGVLVNQRWKNFEAVFRPKIYGAWNLHRLTCEADLDLFVLFSSTAGLFGSPGQSNHAAANAFLDSLAHYRRAAGLPALSINWGVWSQVGAAAQKGADERIALQGIGVIEPEAGIQTLGRILESDAVQVAAVPVNWGVFLERYAGGRRPSWLSGFQTQSAPKPAPSQRPLADEGREIAADLRALPAGKRRQALVRFVQAQTAKVLGLVDAAELDRERPLNEQGVDSLISVELRNLLAKGIGLPAGLPATLVFDYPTIDKIAAFLHAQTGTEKASPAPVPAGDRRGDAGSEDLIDAIGRLSDADADRLLKQQEEGL
jgi:acyl transferase domain-containing protein